MQVWRAILPAALLGSAASAQLPLPPPVPPAHGPENCTAPEHRQFDFWVGDWQVFRTGTLELAGVSTIEKLYGDCAIRENWHPFTLADGGSLSTYVVADTQWRQTWVDSYNARVDFTGGLIDGKMILTGLWRDYGGPGKDRLVRMTYSPGSDGTVRQLGETSADGGKSWAPGFDFTYKPRPPHWCRSRSPVTSPLPVVPAQTETQLPALTISATLHGPDNATPHTLKSFAPAIPQSMLCPYGCMKGGLPWVVRSVCYSRCSPMRSSS